MNLLANLREKNPGLPLRSVQDAEFAAYGRVLRTEDAAELTAALSATEIPAEGNLYRADEPSLAKTAACRAFSRAVFGGMETESGFCNGHGSRLNAFEYHKCPEVNFSSTGCVLLLALPSALRDGKIDSAAAVGFYLPPGVAIEVFPLVLHFAPLRIAEEGFNCLVVLEKGVNEPLPARRENASGEEALLWMKGKWLTAHPDSVPASRGAFAGITGENTELRL